MLQPEIEALLFDPDHRDFVLRRQRTFALSDFEPSELESKDPVASAVQRLVKLKPHQEWWLRRFERKTQPNCLPGTSPDLGLDFSSMRISASAGVGSVDEVLFTDGGRGIAIGWAADLNAQKTAKAVHLFLNDRRVGAGAPSIERPDVAAAYGGPGFLKAGYSITFRWDKTQNVDALKVYAEMHAGEFYELSRYF